MPEDDQKPIDLNKIREMLNEKKSRMKVCLAACAGCTLCAESCFRFQNSGEDPRYMPSYKVLKSLGVLYKKKGKVTRAQLEQMKDLVWGNCALCERCYCPLGIDLPSMIAFTRAILRSQGIDGSYPDGLEELAQRVQADAAEDQTSDAQEDNT